MPQPGDKPSLSSGWAGWHDEKPYPVWPIASCCGEPRVTKELDVCYDHAKVCRICEGPSVDGLCPACEPVA